MSVQLLELLFGICPIHKSMMTIICQRNDEGVYKIRVHKKKGVFSPANQPRPFRESISIEDREEHKALEF